MDNNRQFQQNMEMGSGLTRYRSAPSSYFAALLNSTGAGGAGLLGDDEFDNLFYPRDSSPDTQKILSGLMGAASEHVQESCSIELDSKPRLDSPLLPPRINESAVSRSQQQQSYDYSPSVARMTAYQTQNSDAANAAMQDSYSRLTATMNSNPPAAQMKMEGGCAGAGYDVSSTLIRHSSSPAGLLANRLVKNEFGAKMENSSQTDNVIKDSRYNIPGGYPTSPWDDSVILSDDFLNGLPNNDQRNEKGNQSTTMLSHHLSIPKGSADLSAIEKLMQDSVPYKIRAKRGLATHPRSIAERVRRTKISERMRKLQELVPNMEKQTNTADMLDLAVDYIKDLQIQVKKLTEDRAQCSCSGK